MSSWNVPWVHVSNCTIDVAENRAIASEELVFLDNDRLSRRVAIQGELYVMGNLFYLYIVI